MERDDRPVAFVTGASRGIGKAIALELGAQGFAVAITARTVHEGETREHSSTSKRSDKSPLPGSLSSTAAEIERSGGAVMVLPADLLDRASLGVAAAAVLERWGQVDVLVHNARYIGPGHMDRFLDTPVDILERHLQGNFLAPLVLDHLLLPAMIERGGGTIVDITSGAAWREPPAPAGEGGWGLCYGASKAAFHRVAGILALELGDRGIRAFNVQPGFIATERIAQDMESFGFSAAEGAPAAVVAKVVAWLAMSPDAAALNGMNIEAQEFCHEHRLLAGWEGPTEAPTQAAAPAGSPTGPD